MGREMVGLDYGFTIKDLPEEERPRERMVKYGACALSTPELLAILLRTGSSKASAIELASRLISVFGGLKNLVRADVQDLTKMKGIGICKATEVKAAIELARRISTLGEESRPIVKTPLDAANLVMQEMQYFDREHFRCILLDVKNHVLDVVTISIGGLNSSIVHPRELFKEAIKHSSAGVILVHNHPSGDPGPSSQDTKLTERLVEAGKIMGINILDHIIIGDNKYTSLKELGLMKV